MYKTYKNESIVRIKDRTWIPINLENTDYQEYLTWVAEGNEAEEWSAE
jgi:hypothetical protein